MKLKPSLRNLAKPALLFSLLIYPFVSGCQNSYAPAYKEKDIPSLVKKICKEEYGLDVTTLRANNTLWIYSPLDRILNKEYGAKPDRVFDEGMMEKLRNILTSIGRVLINADSTPEFYALLSSDVNLGLDYTIIGNVLDVKKSFAGVLPFTEYNRRFVMNLTVAPQAIGDIEGKHLAVYDIKLPDYLARQMAQRIGNWFQEEGKNRYFRVEKSEGKFSNNTFILDYSIKETTPPDKPIDIKKEVKEIVSFCIKTYEFKDFSSVEITDLTKQDKMVLNKAAVWQGD